jgi:hypothetical protein
MRSGFLTTKFAKFLGLVSFLVGATGCLVLEECTASELGVSLRKTRTYTSSESGSGSATFIQSFPKSCQAHALQGSLGEAEEGAPRKVINGCNPKLTKVRYFKSEFEDETKTFGKDSENGFCSAKLAFCWSLFHVHSFGGSWVGGGYATRGPPFGQFLQSLVEIQRKGVCV